MGRQTAPSTARSPQWTSFVSISRKGVNMFVFSIRRLRFTHCERRQVVTDQHQAVVSPKHPVAPRRRSVLRRRPVGALPPPYYEAPRWWLGPRTSPRIPAVQVPPTPPPGDTRPHRAARHLRPTRLGTGRDCTG